MRKKNDKPHTREQLLQYAYAALGYKAYSEKELQAKLSMRSDNNEDILFVVQRVKELGYQKDSEVAEIESRRKRGRLLLKHSLQNRGISAELIEETLEKIDSDEEYKDAVSLLEKRWPSLQKTKNPKGNAYGFLARRGYESYLIQKVIQQVCDFIDDQED